MWTGYTLGWYGYATLKQDKTSTGNVGLTDLIIPSRFCKVLTAMGNWSGFSSGQAPLAPPGTGNNPNPSTGGSVPPLNPGGVAGTPNPLLLTPQQGNAIGKYMGS